MKLKMFVILIFSTIFLNSTCKKETQNCHKSILFINQSSRSIYVNAYGGFPDTNICGQYNPIYDPLNKKLNSGAKSKEALETRDCIEFMFDYQLTSDTLMIFVFDADTLEKNSWDTVCKNYMVLKRYDLSLEDLRQMNWQIIF